MPLVRISIPDSLSAKTTKNLSESIHDAMVETINIPEEDQFQIISKHSGDHLIFNPYFLTDRPRTYIVFIQIFLRLGRTLHAKKKLYSSILKKITESTDIPASNVMIVLNENDLADWSFSSGETHYIDDPELFAQRKN